MDRLTDALKGLNEMTLYDVKSLYNQAKNTVLNISEMEAKVQEATNDEPWGASSTLMQEIAQGTFNYQQFNEIMPAIYARFMEKEARQWRQIYKALQLLEYLVKNGSERVVDDARSHIGTIKMLRNFHYIDNKGKDQGINVRNRSKEIVELLGDVDKIRAERRKAKANRTKYTGTGSDGMSFGSGGGRYGGFGSDSFGSGSGGSYSGRDYDIYGESGNSNYGGSSSRRHYQEYDAGDDDIMPRRSDSVSVTSSSTRTVPQRSSTLPSAAPPPEPPKPKQPEVSLLDLDDDTFGSSVPAPHTGLITASGQPPHAGGDDDFDDFQSAPPSAAAANTFLNPIASTPTALPSYAAQPSASVSLPVMQPQVPTQLANNGLFNIASAGAMPARPSYTSPTGVGMQSPMNNMMRPMMTSLSPMSATPPVTMGAPLVPNQPVMAPTSPPARASTTSPGTASQQKPTMNFDELWSMSLGSGKGATGNASTPQKSIKDLEKEKAQAQMWGAGQTQPPMGAGFGSFTGASTTNAAPSSSGNGLDDLLF